MATPPSIEGQGREIDHNEWRRSLQHFYRRLDPYAEYILLFAPLLLLLLVFGFPIVFNLYISFFAWNGTGWPSVFVGLDHYTAVFTSQTLLHAFYNTILWLVVMLTVPVAVGLGIALLINNIIGRSLFRPLFFLPYTVSFVAIGIMWKLMYNSNFGLVNIFLESVGLEGMTRAWLGTPGLNTYAMMVAQGWLFSALAMVVYLAGLQSIPAYLYEAAEIDGLSRVQQFRYITFPMLGPFTTVILVVIMFNVFKIFDIIWVMTGGGPFMSSETLAVSMYRVAFNQISFGKGAAIANVLFFLTAIVTIGFFHVRSLDEVN